MNTGVFAGGADMVAPMTMIPDEVGSYRWADWYGRCHPSRWLRFAAAQSWVDQYRPKVPSYVPCSEDGCPGRGAGGLWCIINDEELMATATTVNGQEWSFWRSRVHLLRWRAWVRLLSVMDSPLTKPDTPLGMSCEVAGCPGGAEGPVPCDLNIVVIGDTVLPPGSSAGYVATRAADGSFVRQDAEQTHYQRAAQELASVAADWALRQTQYDGTATPRTFQEAVIDVMVGCWQILMQKRYQRGVANLVEQGELGILNRAILDKGQRLLRQAKQEAVITDAVAMGVPRETLDQYIKLPGGESFEQDLMDNVNYHMLLLLLRSGYIEAPFKGDTYGD